MQFADPRTDFAFKLIFGNDKAKEVLISFLNAVIGLEVIPAKLDHEPLRTAFGIANIANMTKEEWEAYDAAGVKMQDDRGIAIAVRKEGKQEGKQEIALVMRQKGYALNVIAELTGLAVEEIEKIAVRSRAWSENFFKLLKFS